MRDILECYKVLDVAPGSSYARVREAYMRLLQVWNPERHKDNPVLRQKAEERRQEIDKAFRAIREFLPPPDTSEPEPAVFEPKVVHEADLELQEKLSHRNTIVIVFALLMVLTLIAAIGVFARHRAAEQAIPAELP